MAPHYFFAGTNRTNATARDNLMTGASLGYSGIYVISSLNGVGSGARWHSSRVSTTGYSRFLSIDDNGLIYASDQGSKYYGRSVRCVYYLHW